jgi:hypothetical protein
MPALVAGIHVVSTGDLEDVDGRDMPGHDAERAIISSDYLEGRDKSRP